MQPASLAAFPRIAQRGNACPAMTLTLAALAAIIAVFGWNEPLQFERQGELWRWFTGQLTHWSWNHLAWDVAVFVLFGSLCESRSRSAYFGTLLLASVLISLAMPRGIVHYRGLSGIDSALFALLTLSLAEEAFRARDWKLLGVVVTALLGFVGKSLFEVCTESALFVRTTESFTPLVATHLAGAAAGFSVGGISAISRELPSDIPRVY